MPYVIAVASRSCGQTDQNRRRLLHGAPWSGGLAFPGSISSSALGGLFQASCAPHFFDAAQFARSKDRDLKHTMRVSFYV